MAREPRQRRVQPTSMERAMDLVREESRNRHPEDYAHEDLVHLLVGFARHFGREQQDQLLREEPTKTKVQIQQDSDAREKALQSLRDGFERGGIHAYHYVNGIAEAGDENVGLRLANQLERLLGMNTLAKVGPFTISQPFGSDQHELIARTAKNLEKQCMKREFLFDPAARQKLLLQLELMRVVAEKLQIQPGIGMNENQAEKAEASIKRSIASLVERFSNWEQAIRTHKANFEQYFGKPLTPRNYAAWKKRYGVHQ